MKRRTRKRRILKWSGVGLCVGLAAAWVVSHTYQISYWGSSKFAITLLQGALVGRTRNIASAGTAWVVEPTEGPSVWWPECVAQGKFDAIWIPMWMFLLPTALATAWFWWSDRRYRSGCVDCGYNLTGNVSGACPECGTPIDQKQRDLPSDA
ncbi:MAG: hypothetical protein GXP29_01025 [Planctomycetes bacterium]|nr:hypothetical protein [Planctomycetota bacterium]